MKMVDQWGLISFVQDSLFVCWFHNCHGSKCVIPLMEQHFCRLWSPFITVIMNREWIIHICHYHDENIFLQTHFHALRCDYHWPHYIWSTGTQWYLKRIFSIRARRLLFKISPYSLKSYSCSLTKVHNQQTTKNLSWKDSWRLLFFYYYLFKTLL